MLKSLLTLYGLLDRGQRRQLMALQGLVILMSLIEVLSVLSIGPFMALVGNLSQLQGKGLLAQAYHWSGVTSPARFVISAGAVTLAILVVSTLVSMYTLWRLYMYGVLVGAQLGNRLFKYYMSRPWLFHASANSSHLTSNIADETQRITFGIIASCMQLNAKLVMAVLMSAAIFVYNPLVAATGVGLFAIAYTGLYRLARMRLERNGKRVTEQQAIRFKLMSEGFGGIKELLLLGRQQTFSAKFAKASHEFAVAHGSNQVIAQVPRYAMELLAFGAVIALVIYLVIAHDGQMGAILPILSVYALAGMKLLPAFQQVYSSLTQIRGTLPALHGLMGDLRNSLEDANADRSPAQGRAGSGHFVPAQAIELRGITFTYPNAECVALDQLTLTIPANKTIGIVGASGSGKSTAIDVLLGLITPDSGELIVDGEVIGVANMRRWQDSVGFVAQSIFLADSSIRENIAFGIPQEAIDDKQVERAARLAHLGPLLETLPRGLQTYVGERGVQLSGGQRQRIGIARALYHDAQVLVLDEATSALDGITERLVMDAIHDFGGTKTIVMIAHRISTVKNCDWIYLLGNGRVLDAGPYATLAQRNESFQRMAAGV